MASDGIADGEQTINTLRALLIGLKTIDLPKTVVLVTEGFVMGDQRSSLLELGNLAAAARTGRMELRANAIAQRIEIDPATGKATGVAYIDATSLEPKSASAYVPPLAAAVVL